MTQSISASMADANKRRKADIPTWAIDAVEALEREHYRLGLKVASLQAAQPDGVSEAHLRDIGRLRTMLASAVELIVNARPPSPTNLKLRGLWLERRDGLLRAIGAEVAHG